MAGSVSNIAVNSAHSPTYADAIHSTEAKQSPASSHAGDAAMKADTVKLSLAANIKLMHHRGLSPANIAAQLGMPLKQVDSYLPSVTQAASAATAVPSAAAQGANAAVPSQPEATK